MTAEPAPRRRRRRWPIVLLVSVVVLALLLVAGEVVGRKVATDYAQSRIASALGVPSASEVTVDLGSRPVLLQALEGRLQVVTASSDHAELAGLHGDVEVVARNVGLRDRQAGAVRAAVTIPSQSGLTAIVRKQIDVDSVRFSGGRAVVAKKLGFLGASVAVSETLTVSASGGRVVFTPDRLTIGGTHVDIADVRRGPFASLLGNLTSAQSQCIDSSLPRGLHLESAQLSGSTLHLLVTGIEVDLAGSAKGTCS